MRGRRSSSRLFGVVGLELEYAVVDPDLRVRCLVEEAFRRLHGRPTSEVVRDGVGFSNELAAHVFELKNLAPRARLARAEAELVEGLRSFARLLEDELNARLLPCGMHPFMRPSETVLWQRAGRSIYEAYANLFPIRGHGWLNVQSTHINLPFGDEAETVALHNATACLLPYLPALAASSPIFEGAPGPAVDNRLVFYGSNQSSIPEITGQVIPELIGSYREYRRTVLRPIAHALKGRRGAERLHPEWVNSRGALLRFSRSALEIKVLDVQECVRADVAIAAYVRRALQHLSAELSAARLALPEHSTLVSDYREVVREGGAARVRAPHLGGPGTATAVLERLLEPAQALAPAEERPYLELVAGRLARGSLSERITAALRRREAAGEDRRRSIREIYLQLADCLLENRPWSG